MAWWENGVSTTLPIAPDILSTQGRWKKLNNGNSPGWRPERIQWRRWDNPGLCWIHFWKLSFYGSNWERSQGEPTEGGQAEEGSGSRGCCGPWSPGELCRAEEELGREKVAESLEFQGYCHLGAVGGMQIAWARQHSSLFLPRRQISVVICGPWGKDLWKALLSMNIIWVLNEMIFAVFSDISNLWLFALIYSNSYFLTS